MSDALAVVIVSWNVRELLRRCLRAVEASLAGAGLPHQIVVVDNASGDGTPAMLRAEFPAVRLVEAGANLGFAGGNNLALRLLLAEGRWPFILLLNPDTEPVGDALPLLARELANRPELAVVGPLLHYGDGTVQSSRRRFPTLATMFWESTVLDRLWPGNPWARRYRCADRPDHEAQPVDWLVGAALLVRAAAIEPAGLLDERFFLYSEELEWQRRLQAAWGGRAIWFLPAAVVVHHEGKSSEQAIARRHIAFNRSKLLLARMWFGWRAAALLGVFLRLGFVYEWTVEGLKLAAGRSPRLRRQRLAVYGEVLREL